jgi:hypothetical protein
MNSIILLPSYEGVPVEGVEPPRPFGHMVLSHACIPIPPYRQATTTVRGSAVIVALVIASGLAIARFRSFRGLPLTLQALMKRHAISYDRPGLRSPLLSFGDTESAPR